MSWVNKLKNFFNPTRHTAKLYQEIGQSRMKIKDLFDELKEEEKWRKNYSGALGLLTESMHSMVWQKDHQHKYVLANPMHCQAFFGFEGSKECLLGIFGKTDLDLINNIFINHKRINTFGKICLLSDQYTLDRKEVTHFLESGIVDGIEVLLYVIKIPNYNSDGSFVGTLGIGWDFSERSQFMLNLLNQWETDDKVTTLYKKGSTFVYACQPEIRQCSIFHHLCPTPCKAGGHIT